MSEYKRDLRICPRCGKPGGYIYDTRPQPNGRILRRRRCPFCYETWKSIEVPFEYLEDLIKERS